MRPARPLLRKTPAARVKKRTSRRPRRSSLEVVVRKHALSQDRKQVANSTAPAAGGTWNLELGTQNLELETRSCVPHVTGTRIERSEFRVPSSELRVQP